MLHVYVAFIIKRMLVAGYRHRKSYGIVRPSCSKCDNFSRCQSELDALDVTVLFGVVHVL